MLLYRSKVDYASVLEMFGLTPYFGCSHGCRYCYNRVLRRVSYDKWLQARPRCLSGLEAEVARLRPKKVFLSFGTDPYQPIEKELKLTRRVLENMNEDICLRILTKSNLILRDIDVFMKFKHLEVGLTVNGFNEEIKKVFEPNSPRHEDRVKALKELSRRGLKTYAFISPAIPHLVDVAFLVQQLKDIVDFFIVEPLNIKLCGKRFFKALKELAPNSFNSINSLDKYLSYHRKLRRELQELKVKAMLVAHYPRLCVYKL